jgi:hypothetical protein
MIMTYWNRLWLFVRTNEILLGWLGVLSLVMFVGSLIIVPVIIVALPQNFLTREEGPAGRLILRFWYYPYLIVKNVMGAAFICAGLAMLVLPGQGLLTIFIGIALINFPRKKAFIRGIIGRGRIIQAINKLRSKFNKPPLELPQ